MFSRFAKFLANFVVQHPRTTTTSSITALTLYGLYHSNHPDSSHPLEEKQTQTHLKPFAQK